MRKVIFATLLVVLGFSSCADNEKYSSDTVKERIINCETSENFKVPVKEGYTTYVIYEGDTLAVANTPITIRIPKGSNVATRADDGDGLIVNYEVFEGGSKDTYAKTWQAVMFEDKPNGDYDYNDLVIHVQNMVDYPWNGGKKGITIQTINIQPIAAGGYKTIKLGCVLSDYTEHIIAEDVRQELFEGRPGFVNTDDKKDPVRYKLREVLSYRFSRDDLAKDAAWVGWFIEVDGRRLYAASADLPNKMKDMVNGENMPYGIAVANDNGTFSYPKEEVSIFEAYPDFQKWIDGEVESIGKYRREYIYKYCSGGIIGEDGKKYKIWDYLDLK